MSETNAENSADPFQEHSGVLVNPIVGVLRQFAALLPFVGVYCLAVGYPGFRWEVQLFWTLWTAYFLFCWTSLFHETVHLTLPRPAWYNVTLGRIIGTLLLVPYHVYRESHIRHHAYLNRPNDWELWPYSDPNRSVWFRRVFAWVDLCFGFLTAPYVYGRTYFHPNSPIKQFEVLRAIRREYLAMGLFWGSMAILIVMTGTGMMFIRAWVIPHMLAGIFQVGRKFTEHLGMASFDPLLGTRTVMGRNFITRFASFLNFEIFVHGPHHRYPRVSHQNLKGKMHEHLQREPMLQIPCYSSYLSAVAAMLPSLLVNPGVGMNAGAAALNRVDVADVSEFLVDSCSISDGNDPSGSAPGRHPPAESSTPSVRELSAKDTPI